MRSSTWSPNYGAQWRKDAVVRMLDDVARPVHVRELRPIIGGNEYIMTSLVQAGRVRRLMPGLYTTSPGPQDVRASARAVVESHPKRMPALRDFAAALIDKAAVDGLVKTGFLRGGRLNCGRYTLAERAKWGVQEDGRRMVRVTAIATRLVREAGHPLHRSEILAAGMPEYALVANRDLVRCGPGIWGLPDMAVVDEHLEDEVYVERMRGADGGPFTRGDLARMGLTVGRRRRFLTQGRLVPVADGRWRLGDPAVQRTGLEGVA